MGFFNDIEDNGIRYEGYGFKVYEPTEIQLEELEIILKDQEDLKQDNETLNVKGSVDEKVVRYIIRNMTSIGSEIDEINDDDLLSKINSSNRKFVALARQISSIIEEVVEDIQWTLHQTMTLVSGFIKSVETTTESEKLNNKLNKLLKKHGMQFTPQEFMEMQSDSKKLEQAIKQSKKKIKK